MEMWRATLREAIALGSEHLSSYEVIYEEDTPLFHQLQAGEFDVDEELACAMYDELVATACAHGFTQYEIANFARAGRACAHNVNYWRGGSFYGLGPSATGYVRGLRTKNWSNTQLYCERLEMGRRAIESSEQLAPEARAGETAAFGLRMPAGWNFAEFKSITGFDLREGWRDAMERLVRGELAVMDDDGFRLTPRGLRLADSVAQEFLRLPEEIAAA
jgi:oxygen-independent coproporphyrinogen III oxidase